MYDQAVEADSPAGHRGVGRVVAASIIAITILLAFLIARRTPEYQAEVRLSYVPAAIPSSGAGITLPGAGQALPGAGSALASRVLDDASLVQFITRYDMYPRERLHASSSELAARFRSRLTLSQQASVVKLVFRDADAGRSQTVLNAAAAQLAAYRVVSSVPTALPLQPPLVARKPRVNRTVVSRKKRGHFARQMTGISTPPSGVSVPQNAATRASIAKIDKTLQMLARARAELQADLADVGASIAAAGRAGTSAPPEDPSHAERVRLEQQLVAARASLADLRSRYTENYPGVQDAEQRIAELQGLMARLPAAASPRPRPASVSISSLQSEQQQDEAALAKNAVAADSEQQRRAHLQQQEKVTSVRVAPAVPEEEQSAESADEPADPPADPLPAAIPQPVMTQVTVLPFRIVQAAGPATLVGISKKVEWIALGVSSCLLLVLCFAPLVSVAPRVAPLHAEPPGPVGNHVVYLGNAADSEDGTRRR